MKLDIKLDLNDVSPNTLGRFIEELSYLRVEYKVDGGSVRIRDFNGIKVFYYKFIDKKYIVFEGIENDHETYADNNLLYYDYQKGDWTWENNVLLRDPFDTQIGDIIECKLGTKNEE